MSKAKVVIVEDEFFAANHLKNVLESLGYQVVGVHHDAESFLSATDWTFDTAILDIFLEGGITGIEIAHNLKDRKKPFIFLTANQDSKTLKTAALLEPKAYLSKPFKNKDIEAALEIVLSGLAPLIDVPGKYGNEKIRTNEIWYLKANGNYCDLIARDSEYQLRKTLKEIEEILPNNFVQVHRSYIVNKDFVSQFSSSQLVIGDKIIPISRTFKGELK